MATKERIPLLDTRLELTRFFTADELGEIAGVSLPVITLEHGRFDVGAVLTRNKAFGATVLDGIVMNSLRVGSQTGIQLLGPGDLLITRSDLLPAWLSDLEAHAGGPVRLGLLGTDMIAAAHRWPRIVPGLYTCLGDQLHRFTAQLVICQLPRVDDRVVAMLWLLSETWGHVTPSGVRLPLTLTHETLGALVGAARPTITLALRKLTEQGSIVHQESGWLLLQPPPELPEPATPVLPPELADEGATLWTHIEADDRSPVYAELRETVRALRAQHEADRQEAREQLDRIRTARVRMAATRKRVEDDAVRRRWPPSS